MGRIIYLEKCVEENINELYNSSTAGNKLQAGLILGQLSVNKDFAFHLVRCPDPVDNEAEIEISSSDDDVVVVKTNKKKPKDIPSTSSESDIIDIKWIAEHGRQVNRMLTGGMVVLGMFLYCNPEVLSKNQAKLSPCLLNLHKRIESNEWIRKSYQHNDRYLLHICALTRKLTWRTINIYDDQTNLKPAEHRYQTFLSGWSSVNSVIDVNINIQVPISQKMTQSEQQILAACRQEIDQIWNCYASTEYKLVDEEQLILTSGSNKSGKNKQEVGKEIKLLLFKQPRFKSVEEIIKFESANLKVKFVGSIHSKAFLHSKATYGDAVVALKVDIIRSLLTRIELLCEEAEVNNLDHVEEWSLVSPTRVVAPFRNSCLYFCDYSFKDESVEDISSRFTELLNIKPTVDELIYLERSPDVSEVSMIFHSTEKNIDQQSDIASEISSSMHEEPKDKKVFILILLAFLVALLAVILHLSLH